MTLNGGNKGFKLESATLEDVEEIAQIAASASTSPRMTLEFGGCKREDFLDWNRKAIKAELAGCSNYPDDALALKVVDEESGRIAGFAVWGWTPKASEVVFQPKWDLPLPAGSNTVLRKRFIASIQELEKTHQPSGGYFELLDLVTSPVFQRRGIGSQLVKVGLDKADEESKSCFLSGTPMGVPVYAKQGFEDVGRFEIPLEEYGGVGSHVHVAMIRKPVTRN